MTAALFLCLSGKLAAVYPTAFTQLAIEVSYGTIRLCAK
jgi:hypothetical protein